MEPEFISRTSQLEIPGTSFRLQLGLIDGKWSSRILKGNKVIDSYVYKDIKGDFPNHNLIVGWVLRTIAISNMNPHQIMKTIQALVNQANDNYENYLYPYIFKPPKPPDDLSISGQTKLLIKTPLHEGESEKEPYCKHCGAPISEGETVCYVCGKKVL
jgi:hypothetical protein